MPLTLPRAKLHACLITMAIMSSTFAQQGINNLWMGGYGNEWPPPWGAVDLDFISGSVVVSTPTRTIGFGRTNANITNANGDLLFSTNGAFIANATGETMQNGTGLNPSFYTETWSDGLHLSQSHLILPKPEDPNLFYVIHSTYDDPFTQSAMYLYRTTVDMSLDNGLGGVVTKNQILIQDTLNIGKITAVRHANGRDWWIFCHKVNTNIFYRLLLTPAGVSLEGTQPIGIIRPPDIGQVCFSPDGSKFAYYWGEDDLEVFDFDRCTGLFSDPVHILINDANSMGGVAFSPNSRYLYVSSVLDVYQYDTEAPDIEASMAHIAEWDSTYSPFPPLATMFDIAQLASDGKIYISTGNGTDKLHVIHRPDSAGRACDTEPHGIALPRVFSNTLPNHPNYHLGPVDGSLCDSLGINTGVSEEALHMGVLAYPNPSTGTFTLSYPSVGQAGVLKVRDLSGRLVLQEVLPPWSQVHAMELSGASAGLYNCMISWGARSASTRIMISEQ